MTQVRRYDDLKAAGADSEILQFVEMDGYGGNCPVCRIPWVKVEVRNIYAEFDYYTPVCRCYPRCKRCEMSLHGIAIAKSNGVGVTCPRCGYDGKDSWMLTCHVCGTEATYAETHYTYICGKCKRSRKRSKNQAIDDA